MSDIITVAATDRAALARSHYNLGPAGVSYRDQVAALVLARIADKATLPGIDQFSGHDPSTVAAAAVDLADALVEELVRRQCAKGGG